MGDTDCHSQCAHWLRNDTVNKRCSTSPGGRTKASAPTEAFKGCVGEGLCPSRRAGKSAKRRRWRMQRAGFEEVPRLADTTVAGNRLARRWAREPRPYGEVARGAGKESPSHGFASPAPFRQGGRGDGGDGLPRALCALAMTGGFGNKKGMPVRASLLRFYAGAIALARVCAYSISRRFDCLASWVTLGRISSRTPLSYLALMLAVSMPATLKLRL